MRRREGAARIVLCLAALLCGAPRAAADEGPSLDRANHDFERGDNDAAYPQLVSLAARPVAAPRVYFLKGLIERARGETTRAIGSLRVAVERDPAEISYRLELAMTYAWSDQFAEAITLYDDVLRRHPADRGALLGRARVLSWMRRHAESRAGYEAVLAATPEDIEAFRGLGDDARASLDFRRAIALYNRILVLHPGDAEARAALRTVALETRLQLDAALGAATTNSPRWRPIGSLRAAYQINDKIALLAGYRVEGAPSVGIGGAPAASTRSAWLQAGDVALVLHASPRFDLVLGGRASFTQSTAWTGPTAEAYLHLAKSSVLIGTAHPTLSTQSVVGELSSLGVQQIFRADTWVLAQVFRYDDSAGTHATALVGTANAAIAGRVELRSGGGFTWYAGLHRTLLFGEVSVRTSRTTHVSVRYEHSAGFFEQDLITGGGRFEL